MAGLTEQGLEIRSLLDVIESYKEAARSIFADQVADGDQVDTSDNTALGRLIGVVSPEAAELWEVVQQVYDAKDPNKAKGIALDNLVAYAGLVRLAPSYSLADCIFTGNNGLFIPSGSVVKARSGNNQWITQGGVPITPNRACGVVVDVLSVEDNTAYEVRYKLSGSPNTQSIKHTSSVSATKITILEGLKSAIESGHPLLTAQVSSGVLVIKVKDYLQSTDFLVTTNMTITKCLKTAQVRASEVGPIEQGANTINQISTPILGWDSVNNPFPAAVGRLTETDEELRERFRNAKFERSSNILDSLYSALRNLEGVLEVRIYENDTSVVDEYGVAAHSFMPVVLGGETSKVAQAIWQNKPMGIRSQGNTIVAVNDIQGFSHDIGFERPSPVPIYVKLTITVDPVNFPPNGEEDIKSAIVDYAQNIGVGKDVIFSRLYTPINSVKGHQVDELVIGNTPSPTLSQNVVIPFNAIASFDSNNIEIITIQP